MNALDIDLMRAVDRECSVLQFKEDHEAKNERLEDMMMREVKEARQRIKHVRKASSEEVATIDAEISAKEAEIAALKATKADVQTGIAEKVAAENRRIAKAKAYIAAGA
jgi:septal ring factor EnvC (AmiA/AmiB activator)